MEIHPHNNTLVIDQDVPGDPVDADFFYDRRIEPFQIAQIGPVVTVGYDGLFPGYHIRVQRNADDAKALITIFLIQRYQRPSLGPARNTPAGPEIDKSILV